MFYFLKIKKSLLIFILSIGILFVFIGHNKEQMDILKNKEQNDITKDKKEKINKSNILDNILDDIFINRGAWEKQNGYVDKYNWEKQNINPNVVLPYNNPLSGYGKAVGFCISI